MPKISALPPMATPADDDEAPVVDKSVTATKKWTLTQLKTYLQTVTVWISRAMLANITNKREYSYLKTAMQAAGTLTGIPLSCVVVPTDWVAGTDIVIKCLSRNTVGSGVVVRRLDVYRYRDAAALATIVSAQNVNRTVSSTNISFSTLYTIDDADIAAGDIFGITLSRLGDDGGDTNTGIEDCDSAWIEYTGKA